MIVRLLNIIILSLCAQLLLAEHFWGVSLDAGTMLQLDNQSNTQMQIGGSASAELDYQYRKHLFIFYTGAAFNMYHVGQRVDDVYEYSTIDPLLPANVLSNRTDKLTTFNLAFPFMLGMQYKKFHIAAGCKVYLKLFGNTTTKAQYDYHMEDDKFYDDFINTQLHHQDILIKAKAFVRPDVRPRVEIGWILKQSYGVKDPIFRLALFAEYGLINTLQQDVYDIPADGIRPTVYYYYQSNDTLIPTKTNNLLVGLQFSYMIDWKNLERKLNSTKMRY